MKAPKASPTPSHTIHQRPLPSFADLEKKPYLTPMSEFDRLCKEFEAQDKGTYKAILTQRASRILPALAQITQDGETGVEILSTFILASIAADNRLAEEEYDLISPLLHAFFGQTINYDAARRSFRRMRSEHTDLKRITDEMVHVLGLVSQDLKRDIILVCMLICAIDGRITAKEKAWLRQLFT